MLPATLRALGGPVAVSARKTIAAGGRRLSEFRKLYAARSSVSAVAGPAPCVR